MIPRSKKNNSIKRLQSHRGLETLERRTLLAGDLVLNEFMASNDSGLKDSAGEFSDWIEIHNPSLGEVDLSGWYLTDDNTELDKWGFPEQTLGPLEFLVVFASGKNLPNIAEQHTSFKLASTGGYLALTQAAPTVEDPDAIEIVTEFADYPEQLPNISYGEGLYFEAPTPGAVNSQNGVEGFLIDEITFSQPHGYYNELFQLTLTAKTAGTTIRYTVDGREPTTTRGTDYTGPITIDSTTTIRAQAYKSGLDPSNIATTTYFFLADILTQSPTGSAPTGWPTSRNINGQELNYGMDPDIVNSNTWGPQLEEAFMQVPSMSVVMDINDLLSSSSGIYTHAGSHGARWERPISLEMIDPLGNQEGFTENAGIRIRGGFSRSGGNPKHAFRFFFREEYGDTKLNYPLFGDEGVNEFDAFDLRTTQNYSWAFQGDSRNAFVRDVFTRDMQREMGHPYTRSRYYHLFINGTYWGLYQSQERAEASYAASYMGGNPEDYDVIKSTGSSGGYVNEATDGNTRAYRRLADYFYQTNGLSDQNMDDYWKAQGKNPDGTRNPEFERLLDVENLIDYMLLTYFTGDRDGPGSKFTRPGVNNYFAIINRENPDGFKFFEHDSEHSLDTGESDMVNPLTTGGSGFSRFNPHWMHEQLAKDNSVYRQQFADRVYEQLFNDGLLTPQNAKAAIDARAAEFDMAIVAESARWGDSKQGTPYTKSNWLNAINSVKGFFDTRATTVLNQLRGQGWYPDTNAPLFAVNGSLRHGGRISSSDNISFVARASTSFSSIVPRGSTWKYLDDGSNQGTAWREPNFNDTSWESGRAELGYGDTQDTTIGFGPDSNNKYTTTYFRHSFDVAELGQYQTLQVRVQRDDGAVVYLNGQEIVRTNMPGGTITHDTLAAGVAGGGDETTFFEFDLDIDRLLAGENVLAVEIHQANGNSSDISFDLELRGGNFNPTGGDLYYTLDGSDPILANGELRDTAIKYDGNPFKLDGTSLLRSRLRDNNQWSPLAATAFLVDPAPVAGDLVISEINYNPHRANTRFGDLEVDKDLYEFVELLNTSGRRIDLTGVRFEPVVDSEGASQGIGFEFNTQTIDAGERIVIVKDRNVFAARYGTDARLADGSGPAIDDGVYDGSLRNSGEILTLQAADGSILQQFSFDDGGNWPQRADGGGSSLEIISPNADPALASSWRNSSEYGGSPGYAGDPTPNVVINEVLTHTDLPQIDAIELYNVTDQPVNVGGWYISDGDDYFRYALSIIAPPIPAGGYVVINENQLNFGFRGQEKDDAWLIEATLAGKPIRFADHVEFSAAQNGVSFGRWPNAQGELFPMTELTFGATNSGPVVPSVSIQEVNYNPVASANATSDQLEFVEIQNNSGTPLDISHWRLDRAIAFDFAEGTVLAANQRAVLVSFDPIADGATTEAFRSTYGINNSVRLLGPFDGVLDNGGETLELERPEDMAQLGLGYVLIDRIDYEDDAPWPFSADGQGNSLNRVPNSFGDFSGSWTSALPSPGAAANGENNPSDFNGDGRVDAIDIGQMCDAIRNQSADLRFDLRADGKLDLDDHFFLIERVIGTSIGDSNLDGIFNSADFVIVLQQGQYEDGIAGNSTWATGDWNCSGDFDTGDLVSAFQAGGYSTAATAKVDLRSIASAREATNVLDDRATQQNDRLVTSNESLQNAPRVIERQLAIDYIFAAETRQTPNESDKSEEGSEITI